MGNFGPIFGPWNNDDEECDFWRVSRLYWVIVKAITNAAAGAKINIAKDTFKLKTEDDVVWVDIGLNIRI